MKIVIIGKGGVGKMIFFLMFFRMFVEDGYRVVVVDVDFDVNLVLVLGFLKEVYELIVFILEMKKLVLDRIVVFVGLFGKMFKMNFKVDDIFENFCKEYNGVRLFILGIVDFGGIGCVCLEYVFLKRFCLYLIL